MSAEDIGLRPTLAAEESVDRDGCYRQAMDWLGKVRNDPDLAADTRVAVPIMTDPARGVTRLWVTLGVRVSKLEASYAREPRIRPATGGDWQPAPLHQLRAAHYHILVDEFADVELAGNRVLNRAEFRRVCDRERSREAILKTLR